MNATEEAMSPIPDARRATESNPRRDPHASRRGGLREGMCLIASLQLNATVRN